MGKFIGIIAAALEQQDGEFIQTTELLDFPDEVWVYYCRPHLGPPKPGWTDLAAGTLRVSLQPEPFRWDKIEWQPSVTTEEESHSFTYVAELFGVEWGNNIFHLALPPGFLPVADSWDVPPLYGHADGARFVLGWSVEMENWPTFQFKPVEAEAFAERAEALDRAIERESRARRRQALNAWLPSDQPDLASMLERLDNRLNLEDTRTLAAELGIDFDNLGGEGKIGKLRELLLYLDRHQQLPHLLRHLQKPKYGHVFRG